MEISDSELQGLLEVEQQIADKVAELHNHHQAIQRLDYDADAKLLRPHLDTWLDWHLWASDYLVQLKQSRWKAQADFQKAWRRVHTDTRDIEMAATLPHYSAYQEREVFYQIKTLRYRQPLDVLDRLVDVTYDFLRMLKSLLDHWDKRRVDTKWEIDRMSRLPGADYEN